MEGGGEVLLLALGGGEVPCHEVGGVGEAGNGALRVPLRVRGGLESVDDVLPLLSLVVDVGNGRWRGSGDDEGGTNDKALLGRAGTDTLALKLATMGDACALRVPATLKGDAARGGENLFGAYTTTAVVLVVVVGPLREVNVAEVLTLALGRITEVEESCG